MNLSIPSETLARGLRDRFFDEALDGVERSGFVEAVLKHDLSQRNEWAKFIAKTKKSLSLYALSHYEGGGKRRPYFVLNMIEIRKSRPFNQWQEKCLQGCQISAFSNQNDLNVSLGPYNIGEHAVLRLFMRSPLQLSEKEVNFRSITSQFSVIPFWSNYWVALYTTAPAVDPNLLPEPQIPSQDGVFLCSFSDTGRNLEVRTFVSKRQLTQEQESTRVALYEASKSYLDSPLTAYPSNWLHCVDTSELTMALLSRDLLQMEARFLESCTRRIKDPERKNAIWVDLLNKLTTAARLNIEAIGKLSRSANLRGASYQLFRDLTSGVMTTKVTLQY